MSLSELSYKELQNIAKESGIRANQKREDLLEQLTGINEAGGVVERKEEVEEEEEEEEEEDQQAALEAMKYSELRKLASSYGLQSTGRKDVLVERIMEHLKEEEEVEEEVEEEEVVEEEPVVEEEVVEEVEEEPIEEAVEEVVEEVEEEPIVEEEDIELHLTGQEDSQEQQQHPQQDVLSSLVEQCEHLEWVDYMGLPRVRCTLTNHVMLPSLTVILSHLDSKKVKRALEAEEVDLLCMLHGLQVIRRDAVPAFIEAWETQQQELGTMLTMKHVPKIVSSDMVFCPLTQTLLSKRVRDINNHIKGKRFQKALREENQTTSSRSYSSMDSTASDQIMRVPLSPNDNNKENEENEEQEPFKLNGIASPKNKHILFASPEPQKQQNENVEGNQTTPKSLRSTPTRARRTSLRLSARKNRNEDANILADLCEEEREDPVTWYGDFSY
jgi:hypothetical protein